MNPWVDVHIHEILPDNRAIRETVEIANASM